MQGYCDGESALEQRLGTGKGRALDTTSHRHITHLRHVLHILSSPFDAGLTHGRKVEGLLVEGGQSHSRAPAQSYQSTRLPPR